MELNKGGYPVKNAGYWKRQHDKLQAKITAAEELIDTLYESGCLDAERKEIVQVYLAT